MISRLNYSFKYLHYWLFSKHKKGHGIHSPFVFSIVKNVFNNNSKNEELTKVFKIVDYYKKNKQQRINFHKFIYRSAKSQISLKSQ